MIVHITRSKPISLIINRFSKDHLKYHNSKRYSKSDNLNDLCILKITDKNCYYNKFITYLFLTVIFINNNNIF